MSSLSVSPIETLYPDALRQIVEYLSPTWIVNLWLTGSVFLRTSLAKRGALTKLRLAYPEGFFSTSRLPGMIASFDKLTCLSITGLITRITTPLRMWKCLSQLHLLKTLKLHCVEADEWMFEPCELEVDLTCFSFDDDEPSSHNAPTIPKLRPLATTYPHLETLDINHMRLRRLQNEHLLELPPTLTWLQLQTFDLLDEKCLAYTQNLPKLATVKLYAKECSDLTGIIPSSITSLTISSHHAVDCPPSFWAGSSVIEVDIPFSLDAIASLPPSIEKLYVRRASHPGAHIDICHLPRLKHLTVSNHDVSLNALTPLESLDYYSGTPSIPIECVSTRLKSIYFSWYGSGSFNLLPWVNTMSSLTKALISCKADLKASDLCDLPQTLTSLEWYQSMYGGHPIPLDDAVDKLPRGLQQLSFTSSPLYISSSAFHKLPRSLRSLSMKHHFASNLSPEVCASHVKQLPRSMTSWTSDQYVLPSLYLFGDPSLVFNHYLTLICLKNRETDPLG